MPKIEKGNPLEVSVNFDVRSLDQDETRKSLEIKSVITMKWIDNRFKWDQSQENVEFVYTPINTLWVPEILQYNS